MQAAEKREIRETREARAGRKAGRARRHWALGAALLSAIVLMSLVGPGTGTAQAAGRCKGHKVDTLWFSTGSVKIYRSGNKLCALTVAKRTGSKKPMMVSIQARGHRPVTISGKAKKYMGGVTVTAGRTRPVWVRGSVGAGKVSDGWLHV